ncbi:MAG: hypothetical protein JXM69_00730 [Anaerolineae bacterium]|nr:hypothetical protein [Anaerolineae bacterium]
MITIVLVVAIVFVALLVSWLFSDTSHRVEYQEPEPPPFWTPPDINEPPPKVEPEPTPYIPDWYPEWWLELAELGRVSLLSPEDDDLDEWVFEVVRIAYTQFEGRLSPKMNLYPFFRHNTDYGHIPPRWKSLHFFEGLSAILRKAGFAEMTSQRSGLRLNEKGIEQFRADPNRWYP